MTFKICHEWVEGVEATCPHCGVVDIYHMVGDIGDIMQCLGCGKQFQLGE